MTRTVVVGRGSCGIAAGAGKVYNLLSEKLDGNVALKTAGCVGACYLEPIVDIVDDSGELKRYVNVDEKGALEIINYIEGKENALSKYEIPGGDAENISRQTRVALANCGIIDPESIDEYIAKSGYEGAKKCILEYNPEQIIEVVKTSGLGGRGGAGFPTWFKWQAAKDARGDKKYVICNADEGDPGAFMDRAILEGDPHAILEGMLISARAIGSDEGIIYVRAEYPLAIKRLEGAIAAAEERGFLGKNILGSNFNFSLRIKAGAGAFVCGEETALIASVEGERGMPRLKPPYPAEKGYNAKPTNINNVETYANIPWIIRNGGEAFSKMGTERSKGTKVFALTGRVKKGGLAEIPMGSTIEDVIFGIGGGIKDDREFKAVQMGGPSGGCIPAHLKDTLIDYQSLAATGAIMGSGGMVVMDESTCMVDVARYFLDFTCKESCGKCTHCRIGTKRLLEILERITRGEGRDGDIELLEDLGKEIKEGSLCGLGQTAPNPVLTTIRYFRNEYEDHIYHKKCTAHSCKALISYSIDEEKCTGCSLCSRKCPVEAISGELKKTYTIDPEKCIKCGKCDEVCNFGAVLVD